MSKLNRGILKMAQSDRREVIDYQVTRDMINHNFLSKGLTKDGYQMEAWQFMGFVILPTIAQMATTNLAGS